MKQRLFNVIIIILLLFIAQILYVRINHNENVISNLKFHAHQVDRREEITFRILTKIKKEKLSKNKD